MSIYSHIGDQIRKLREEMRLSQEALAKEVGVSTNTVSRWETATYKLSINDLQKIAEFFKVRISKLLPAEETAQPKYNALLSAIGELPQDDIDELTEYAEFRRARRLLEEGKKAKK